MKKVLFAAMILMGLNFASMAQTTPAKKEAAKTEVKQTTQKEAAPAKKAHKKHKKHHKKHAAAKKEAAKVN